MTRKTLAHSVKVLKISTWISGIAAFLVVLLVGFFVIFPASLKTPIEQQLSNMSGLNVGLSKITFDFEAGSIFLKAHDIEVFSDTQQPLFFANNVRWQVNWVDFFDGIYHPSKIFIDTLNIYSNVSDFNIADIKAFFSAKIVQAFNLFMPLHINKTHIIGQYQFMLMPLLLTFDDNKLQLNVATQKIGNKNFDINAVFSLDQIEHEYPLKLSMTASGKDFKLSSTLQFYSQQGSDFVEFSGFIDYMDADNIAHYLSAEIVGGALNQWLNDAFKSGNLNDIKFNIKQDLLANTPPQVRFNAHLNNAELLFNADWQALKQLDANISLNNQQLEVEVNSAVLNKLPLQNIKVKMSDIRKGTLEVRVVGKVSTQSEKLVAFLKTVPISHTIKSIFDKFSLSGEFVGDMNLLIPLDDRVPIINVVAEVKNNRLSTLNGAIVVEDFTSQVKIYDNTVTTEGMGSIRDITFNIRLNPKDVASKENALFEVELFNEESGIRAFISQQTQQIWFGKIDSDVVSTDVKIMLNDKDLPSVTLENLKITDLGKIKGDWHIVPNDIPSMYLKSNGISVDNYKLPDFKVDLHSQQDVLNIHNLEFEGIGVNQNNLNFNGSWLGGVTTLVAQANDDNLSDFLKKINIKEKVKGGGFDLDIRLFCQCAPWNMNFKDITGHVSINVKEGIFSDKDSNIGRVLSLLNIQSIARRLKLKVNDLTSKGFVYDDIQASVYLSKALAQIERFELNATSSTIKITGNSHIIDQKYNLLAKVRPAIVDSVPIATYLAGGGLTGLGVWLADKVLFDGKIMGAIVGSVSEFEYRIIGPWDAPIIEKL